MPIPLLPYYLVAVKTCLFVEPLLRNGCCMVACFAVVSYQRIYIATTLRLSLPNSLQVYRHFFFSEGCDFDVFSFISEGIDPSSMTSHSYSAA
jgi:hypothetical protein